jgi:hypothetical protein
VKVAISQRVRSNRSAQIAYCAVSPRLSVTTQRSQNAGTTGRGSLTMNGPISVETPTPPNSSPGTTDFGYHQKIDLKESRYRAEGRTGAAPGTATRYGIPKWTGLAVTSQQKSYIRAWDNQCLSSVSVFSVCRLIDRALNACCGTEDLSLHILSFPCLNTHPLLQYSRVHIGLISRKFPQHDCGDSSPVIATLA